ncbi:MAG: hypothetical protein ACREMM_07980 [Gemmatimonadales bacterium]
MDTLRAMKTGVCLAALSVALLAACGGTAQGGGGPGEPGPGDPRDVASVRLFDAPGTELTQHMPLVAGETTRVEVRLYAAKGRQITSVTGGLELGFAFSPSSLASSTPVDGQPLIRDVTSSAAPGTPGTLAVALYFPADASTKTFGPFDVLVH